MTPVCDSETLTLLLMALPGRAGKQLRRAFARILCAYLSGEAIQRQGVSSEERMFYLKPVQDEQKWIAKRGKAKIATREKSAMLQLRDKTANPGHYRKINGSINYSVTGMTKAQLKTKLNIIKKNTQWTARNHFTAKQLGLVATAEDAVSGVIANADSTSAREDGIDEVNAMISKLSDMAGYKHQAIEESPRVPKTKGIAQFFQYKN